LAAGLLCSCLPYHCERRCAAGHAVLCNLAAGLATGYRFLPGVGVRNQEAVPNKDAVATPPNSRQTAAAGLAALFPQATAVRIPVRVRALRGRAARLEENTVIEFGTAREVLFASSLPLEFEDHVEIETSDRSLQAEAAVVAVQFHDGRKAVAARFLTEVSNWIIKP
jgi:hypothetical protein